MDDHLDVVMRQKEGAQVAESLEPLTTHHSPLTNHSPLTAHHSPLTRVWERKSSLGVGMRMDLGVDMLSFGCLWTHQERISK